MVSGHVNIMLAAELNSVVTFSV